MPELDGFSVSVHSEDEQLNEYSIEISPDGKKATCWIPSQSGEGEEHHARSNELYEKIWEIAN